MGSMRDDDRMQTHVMQTLRWIWRASHYKRKLLPFSPWFIRLLEHFQAQTFWKRRKMFRELCGANFTMLPEFWNFLKIFERFSLKFSNVSLKFFVFLYFLQFLNILFLSIKFSPVLIKFTPRPAAFDSFSTFYWHKGQNDVLFRFLERKVTFSFFLPCFKQKSVFLRFQVMNLYKIALLTLLILVSSTTADNDVGVSVFLIIW